MDEGSLGLFERGGSLNGGIGIGFGNLEGFFTTRYSILRIVPTRALVLLRENVGVHLAISPKRESEPKLRAILEVSPASTL